MPTHDAFQQAFAGSLHGGALPPGVTAADPSEAARRFDVYRNNVAVSLTEALAARFPVVGKLVGAAFFRAMVRFYAEIDPPMSPVLAEWGAGFADFLAQFPPLAGYPYLPDVARIEYARGRAYHAADAGPVDPARIAGADPDRLRLELHPSVTVLHLSHPAVSIWAKHQPGGAQTPIPAGPEIALILRAPSFQVPVTAISPGDAALITALQSGATLTDAAMLAAQTQPNHAPQPILLQLMRAGAIVGAGG